MHTDTSESSRWLGKNLSSVIFPFFLSKLFTAKITEEHEDHKDGSQQSQQENRNEIINKKTTERPKIRQEIQ